MTASGKDSPVRIGLIGSGWIGSFHAQSIAQRVPGAVLSMVADPVPGAAERLASSVGGVRAVTDAAAVFAAEEVDAVLISAPADTHADLVVAAAAAGKAVFCEKPMALTLADADRAIEATQAAGVALQVGFNRRFAADFAAAHDSIVAGDVGQVQLMRSVTRDPGLSDPSKVKPWVIFFETLIHDFDALSWLNPGARPIEVYAIADALIRPDFKDRGLLDTAVVVLRFDNGAMATAEASFQAVYGYDIRGEVFGSAGMVTAGDVRRTAMTAYKADGIAIDTVRLNTELFRHAYTAQLVHFVHCVRTGTHPTVTGADARRALSIALAARTSVESGRPVQVVDPVPR
ncbi:MAG TPA: Gfo/Idh/MocA family oxidoreductase [Jatrophihabitans sp.]